MARSVLLQLARDSITEVFEAKRHIDKSALLQEHPLLNEIIPTTVKLFIDKELKGNYTTQNLNSSLLSNIIVAAKKAAFEDKTRGIITTSEYLHSEIELILDTPDGKISETDPAILPSNLNTTLNKTSNRVAMVKS